MSDLKFAARLLDGAANVREYVVGVRADEPDRADYDHQDNRQHHRILGDILSLLILPEILPKIPPKILPGTF